jgi:hypothetical protein
MNLPGYEFLPAPLELLTLLHLLTLTLHLLAMGALFGGLGALLLARVPRKWSRPGATRLVRLLPTLMAVTVTLGVAPLLFLQLVYHRQVYAAAIVSAWFWLALVAAAMLAYFLFYSVTLRPGRPETRTRRLVLAFFALAFVSLVISSVLTLAERPETIARAWAADPSGAVLNPELGRWLPRWLHLVAGALAIGSFALAALSRDDEELSAAARRSALWWMIAAIALGFGALAGLGDQLPAYLRSAAAAWMVASLALGLGALHFLFRRRMVAAGALLFGSLAAMVVQRHLARLIVLGGALDPSAMAVRPQWGVFALFLACFVAMAATLAWMLRLFFARPPASGI